MAWYPKEVYNIREDVTRENMRKYDLRQARIMAEVLKAAPDYYSLPIRERLEIKRHVEESI